MGLTLERGDRAARSCDSCGAWSSYDLVADGIPVPHGSRTEVGDLVVRHGGYEETDRSRGCIDWFIANVAVAITE